MNESFADRLSETVERRQSQVVLGLDPDPARVPGGVLGAEEFCLKTLAAAGEHCALAKIQLAHFERFGAEGWKAYEAVAAAAAGHGLLVIADAKRGDIDATARAYAEAFLKEPVDALTINPMLGSDAVRPFLDAALARGRGLFVLVRTSNPGGADLQDLELADGRRWHEALAEMVAQWGAELVGSCGLSSVGAVVGATGPERLAALRALMPDQPFLLPGVGDQGGRAEDLAPAFGGRAAGGLIAASRSIIYADNPEAAAADLRVQGWSAWESVAPS